MDLYAKKYAEICKLYELEGISKHMHKICTLNAKICMNM